MKDNFKILIRAILAGVMISIGGTIFLTCESKLLGAFLFSIGLYAICAFGLNLYTGKIGYVIDNKPKYFVLGKCWRKHVDDVEDQCVQLYRDFMCNKLYNETNGDKGYLNKDLKAKGVRSIPYHEDMNKYLKISTYLKSVWNDIIFVTGTDEDYINQICDYNEDAEHDDCPDSLASLIRKKWGTKVRVGTESSGLMFL